MGSLTVNIGSGGQMRLDVSLISQDYGANNSTIAIRGYLINTTGTRSFKNDPVPMSIYGTAGTFDNPSGFNVAAHSEQLVVAIDTIIPHDGNGYASSSIGFHVGNTGTVTFGGGGDAAPVNDNWPRIPKPPNPPIAAVDGITATSAHVYVVAAGDDNGSGADYCNYRIHRVSDGAWMGDLGGPGIGYGGVVFTNLARVTTYDAYAQTHNGMGYGGFSPNVRFTTPAQAPSSPGTSADTLTPVSARIVVTAPADNGGTGIDAYEAYVMSNNAYPDAGGAVVASASGGTFTATGLIPSTQYYYTSRARNTQGLWSAWTPMQAFTTLPSAQIKVGGVYKNAIPFVKQGGVYKMAIPYKKLGGVYRQ